MHNSYTGRTCEKYASLLATFLWSGNANFSLVHPVIVSNSYNGSRFQNLSFDTTRCHEPPTELASRRNHIPRDWTWHNKITFGSTIPHQAHVPSVYTVTYVQTSKVLTFYPFQRNQSWYRHAFLTPYILSRGTCHKNEISKIVRARSEDNYE